MKKKTNEYTDYPISAKVIPNFLPPPEQLVLKDDTVKVTLALNESSVLFFKLLAKKHHTQYQKMIRNLLDHYVRACKAHEQNRSRD
ncbi:MAG TPA: CopG family transcriptional regulator [Gammaproteobacteria bacterium]|nr:CopG family transcriptional regulator [Gammaproteobacteria bacterium]